MSDPGPSTNGLPLAVVQQIIEVAAPGVVVVGVRALRGGDISAVYHVALHESSGHPDVIVKVYPEQLSWKMRKEVYVYGQLSRLPSLPTPRVLAADDSHALLPASYLVLSQLPGRMLSDVADGCDPQQLARVYERLGGHLRAMHGLTFESFGYLYTGVVDPHPSNAAYLRFQFAKKLDEFARLGGARDLLGRIESYVDERADALAVCQAASLCHDDVYDNNVLVDVHDGVLEMTGLLDVENAVAGDPLIDLAKTWLYSIRDDTVKWRGLRSGYGDLGALAQERLELYRVYHTLELWDWFASIDETGPLRGLTSDLHSFLDGTAAPIDGR